jgi:capsid protein
MKNPFRNKYKEIAIKTTHQLTESKAQTEYYRNNYNRALTDSFTGAKSISLSENYVSLAGEDYEALQDRCYTAIWDSIQGRSLIKQLKSLTINTGLKLQAIPERFILGITPEQAGEWSEKTESNWRLWRKLKESDYEEKNNFSQIEGIAADSFFIFGEFFMIFRYENTANRVNPLSIQLIPPHMVKQPDFTKVEAAKRRGNKVKDGIELDKRNREIAIYIYNEDETEQNKLYTRVEFKNNGLVQVVHGFTPETPGQVRGIPSIAPIVHELVKITDLSLAELDSAIANSVIAGAIERGENVVNNNKLQTIGDKGSSWTGSDDDEPEKEVDNTVTRPRYEEREVKRGGFHIQNLEKGESLKSYDTKRPNLNIPAMIDKIMEYAGPAIGLPLEVIKMLFGQNYSASKGAVDLAWKAINILVQNYASDCEREVYKAWMIGEIAKGRIIAPGFETPVIRAAWLNSNWVGLPVTSLNPFVEAKAGQLRAKEGFSNREWEAQNLTGTSYDDNVDRLSQENPKLENANKSLENQETVEA